VRTVATAVLLLLSVPAAALRAAEQGGHDNLMLYRVVNFLLLGAGLGYLIKKKAGGFFSGRGEAIRRELAEARRLLEESRGRTQGVEERLARLGREIEELRSAGKAEIAAEHARLEQQAEQTIRKILAQAEREMGAAAKAARMELKTYAASLAVDLAEKRVAGRITPRHQQALVSGFLRDLERASG